MTDPGHRNSPEADEALEVVLGNLLRIGVIASAAVVASGGIALLLVYGKWVPDFRVFQNAASPLRSVAGILREGLALHPGGIVQTGILLLIATPVLRVVFSLFGFARQRDWLYVVLTMIVLAVLSIGLVGWRN